jgi:hypothetical protein
MDPMCSADRPSAAPADRRAAKFIQMTTFGIPVDVRSLYVYLPGPDWLVSPQYRDCGTIGATTGRPGRKGTVPSRLSIPTGARYPPLALSMAQQRRLILAALLGQLEALVR